MNYKTNDQVLEGMLRNAKHSSEDGLVEVTLHKLFEINQYIIGHGLEIPGNLLPKIRDYAIERGIAIQLAHAAESADNGEIGLAKLFLDHAKSFSERGGYNIPSELSQQILKRGYENYVKVQLENARSYANQGKEDKMYESIQIAQNDAGLIKMDISKEVQMIVDSLSR